MEPHDITTVSRRPPVGMDKPRTLQDYQADLMVKLKVAKMPSWAKLAARENRRMWVGFGNPHKGEPNVQKPKPNDPRDAMRATWQSKVEEARQEVIRVLEKPMTTCDVARVLGIKNQHTAHTRLLSMAEEGLIVVRKVKGFAVWERRMEAAE